MHSGAGDHLILASGSRSRRTLLENAGLRFDVVVSDFNEQAARQALEGTGATPGDTAEVLARGKAELVSATEPVSMVIGGDQILALGDEIFEKPVDLEDARNTLLKLRGRTHTLHAAVCLTTGGKTIWSYVDTAHLQMRDFSPEWLGRYLANAGEDVCQSVGAYQLEGRGVQLFEKIIGSYFTILGIPLLPLLDQMRQRGMIA